MRTNNKWIRPYLNGYRIGGWAANVGNVGYKCDVQPEHAYTDAVKNSVAGFAEIAVDPINTILAPDVATGVFELCNSGLGTYDYMIAYGAPGEPITGNPMFAWRFEQAGYEADPGSGFVMANIALSTTFVTNNPAVLGGYGSPWGVLAHADGAETAANTAIGIDDWGAVTLPNRGGLFFWHLFSSDGTVTLSLEEASTNSNGSFGALSGATSGSITAAVLPKSGQVALSNTAAVKRYIRWQMAKGTASTATFALGWIRGR